MVFMTVSTAIISSEGCYQIASSEAFTVSSRPLIGLRILTGFGKGGVSEQLLVDIFRYISTYFYNVYPAKGSWFVNRFYQEHTSKMSPISPSQESDSWILENLSQPSNILYRRICGILLILSIRSSHHRMSRS